MSPLGKFSNKPINAYNWPTTETFLDEMTSFIRQLKRNDGVFLLHTKRYPVRYRIDI